MQKGHKEFKDQVNARMSVPVFSKQTKATRLSPEIFFFFKCHTTTVFIFSLLDKTY